MRTRDEIEKDNSPFGHEAQEMWSRDDYQAQAIASILEVLLDIRDLLANKKDT